MGNPILSDDAVGLAVTSKLKELLDQAPLDRVDVLESTRAGFELIDLLHGYSHALIIDALAAPQPEPGRMRFMSLENFAGSVRLVNPHELSVESAFKLAQRLNISMPAQVEIVAIDTADTLTLSEEMTAPVAAAVSSIAQQVYDHLAGLQSALSEQAENQTGHAGREEPPQPFYPPQRD